MINVVPGYGSIAGLSLVKHPNVDKITFTGSTAVGNLVMKNIGESCIKRVTLGLGGKSALIIFADAPDGNFHIIYLSKPDNILVDLAAEMAHDACMTNNGQCCVAGTRTYVEAPIYDKVVAKLKHLAETRIIGDPFDHKTQQGPQVREKYVYKWDLR